MTVAIRLARHDDANAVSALLNELGYGVSASQVAGALAQMKSAIDPAFIATDNGIAVGLVAVHIARWLQLDKPIARVTALIVRSDHQRRGIGRQLLDQACSAARDAGCGTIELTTAVERGNAHAFYRGLGFAETSVRFKKLLP